MHTLSNIEVYSEVSAFVTNTILQAHRNSDIFYIVSAFKLIRLTGFFDQFCERFGRRNGPYGGGHHNKNRLPLFPAIKKT